jgi:steroid 5-alpha reductase family enzyme
MSCVRTGGLLRLSAALSYGMQLVNFYCSKRFGDNFTGLVEFLPAALAGFALSGSPLHSRAGLATAALALWSTRLTAFLVYRLHIRQPLDGRLDQATEGRRGLYLAGFWAIHGTWGFVVSFPVTFLNGCAHGNAPVLGVLDATGLVIWLFGFVLESWADHVKLSNYQQNRIIKDRYYSMNGHFLWGLSRNPNFCGEMMCWLGLTILAWTELDGPYRALSLLSPGLTLFIMLVEAVWYSELKNNIRFADDIEYQAYKLRTSILWLCPQALYALIPRSVQVTVLLDFPAYYKRDHRIVERLTCRETASTAHVIQR